MSLVRKREMKGASWSGHPVRSYGLAFLFALIAGVWLYGPALYGPWVFDDRTLPFASPAAQDMPLFAWLRGVRPVLMFTYWLNYNASTASTLSYHLVNVFLHVINAALIFAILRFLLKIMPVAAGYHNHLAGFGAVLFLVHPLQTESVAYIAGRSEVLCGTFFLAAVALYLFWGTAGLSWRQAGCIAVLFGLAVGTKEHAAVLPIALLLADRIVRQRSLRDAFRRNRRLFLLFCVICAVAGVAIVMLILTAPSVGRGLDVAPHQYFYTQCRAILTYLRLFVVPFGLNIDHDFPISRTLADYGAAPALWGILVMIGCAIYWRSRFPVVSFGVLLFFLLIAPTSSVIPIADPLVEHRMYLPSVGLIIGLVGLLAMNWTHRKALVYGMSGVLLVGSALSWQRNQVWGDPVKLWTDAVAKSPRKIRPYPHLIYSYVLSNRCAEAVSVLERAGKAVPVSESILVNWAEAYGCAGRYQQALQKLEQALKLNPSAEINSFMSVVLAQSGRHEEALKHAQAAIDLEPPGTDMSHFYRGQWYAIAQQFDRAEAEYNLALALNPYNAEARSAIVNLKRTVVTVLHRESLDLRR
jgi:Flp pilus assembly protein TadD